MPGDPLLLAYLDHDNTDPGIPWERSGRVEQIGSEEPQVRIYDVSSRLLDLAQLAALLAGARHVVGLDTGFTHLAAALGRPTLGIYCDHEPGLAGITGSGRVASIGGKGQVPKLADVMSLLDNLD